MSKYLNDYEQLVKDMMPKVMDIDYIMYISESDDVDIEEKKKYNKLIKLWVKLVKPTYDKIIKKTSKKEIDNIFNLDSEEDAKEYIIKKFKLNDKIKEIEKQIIIERKKIDPSGDTMIFFKNTGPKSNSESDEEKPKKNVKEKKRKIIYNDELEKSDSNKILKAEKALQKKHEKILKKQEVLKDIGTIMQGKSELYADKKMHMVVKTNLNVKKGLNSKVKKALETSVVEDIKQKIKGKSIKL